MVGRIPARELHKGDVVAVVQTDKSDLDVEVFIDGTLQETLVPAGIRVPVGTVLATISAVGAVPGAVAPTPSPAVPDRTVTPADQHLGQAQPEAHGAGTLRSPVLRHLADQLHVDVGHLAGTGPGGSITRDDIERTARRPRATPRARRLAKLHGVDLATVAGDTAITGERVLHAVRPEAVAPTHPPADAMRARDRAADDAVVAGDPPLPGRDPRGRAARSARSSPSGTSSVPPPAACCRPRRSLRAAARAAADAPGVNGWWIDGAFAPAHEVHLGIVVSLRSGGLLAPVIRDADQKSLDEVMAELRDLVTRARSGRLRGSQLSGATFTVTQLGDNEVEIVVPIIHPPQVAILGLGSIHDQPWAIDGMIGVRPVVHATLAADHRAVDGRIGSLYLTALAHLSGGVHMTFRPPLSSRRRAAPASPRMSTRSTVDADLHDDLGLDSMDLLNLAVAMSQATGRGDPRARLPRAAHDPRTRGVPRPPIRRTQRRH